MSNDPWSDGFRSLELKAFVQELSTFLRSEDYPEYSSVLFCRDEQLNRELNDVPIYKEVFGGINSKISSSIFFTEDDFQQQFSEIRSSGFGWIHIKVHGVLDNNLMGSLVTPETGYSMSAEDVGMRLFSLSERPEWRLK